MTFSWRKIELIGAFTAAASRVIALGALAREKDKSMIYAKRPCLVC